MGLADEALSASAPPADGAMAEDEGAYGEIADVLFDAVDRKDKAAFWSALKSLVLLAEKPAPEDEFSGF